MGLEGYATRLAAARITDDELRHLEELTKRSASLPFEALQERVAVNTEFHGAIYRACGVPQLVRTIEQYSEYFMTESELSQLDQDESRKTVQEHTEIVDALRSRDAGMAEDLIRAHLLDAFRLSIERQGNKDDV